jgi:hypothetical protein
MRLMQAEQSGYHSRKSCKFGLRFLPIAVIENALPALISNTLGAINRNYENNRHIHTYR